MVGLWIIVFSLVANTRATVTNATVTTITQGWTAFGFKITASGSQWNFRRRMLFSSGALVLVEGVHGLIHKGAMLTADMMGNRESQEEPFRQSHIML